MNLRRFTSIALLALLLGSISISGRTQPTSIVVDHNSLALFPQIPPTALQAARDLTMMFVDRSVGDNIREGFLDCTANFPTTQAAPNRCKRINHIVPAFSSPLSEIQWNQRYPTPNFSFRPYPGLGIPNELNCGFTDGSWSQNLACIIRWADANPNAVKVLIPMPSYLDVAAGSDIASPTTGFFVPGQAKASIDDLQALLARHPQITLVWATSSLARGIGTQEATDFNNQVRAWVAANGGILLDVADIESHDPSGNPCVDNRDGVPYANSNASENHPDDGVAYPAICQHYTRETDGGHLGNPDVGKIRMSKAMWVLMAQVAGWTP